MTIPRRPLADYLAREYRFNVIAGYPDEGGYVIEFPDLPDCLTQVESLDELVAIANEIQELWIETEYERGRAIPSPSYPEEYSGKFNVRLPKSLHRQLAKHAVADGVSLNQHVVALLAAGNAVRAVGARNGHGYAASSTEPPPVAGSPEAGDAASARQMTSVAS